jgi:hypothetical protein
MRKSIIFGIVLILLSSFVLADIQYKPNFSAYYEFDDMTDSTGNYTSSSTSEPTYQSTAPNINGNYGLFTGSEYFDSNINYENTITVNFWGYDDDWTTSSKEAIISWSDSTGSKNKFVIQKRDVDNQIHLFGGDGDCNNGQIDSGTTLSAGWHMFTVRENSTYFELFLDGVSKGSVAKSSSGFCSGIGDLHIGRNGEYLANLQYFTGRIDELFVHNEYMSQQNITAFYNAGSGVFYDDVPNVPVVPEGFVEITLKNLYDDSGLTNFNVTITNTTDSTSISTTNGTVFYNSGETVNLTFHDIESNTYIERTFVDVDLSSNYVGYVYQSVLNIIAKERVSNNVITSYNATIESNENVSNAQGNITYYLNAGTYSITGSSNDFLWDTQRNVTLNTKDDLTTILYFGNNSLNITVLNGLSNTSITDFDVFVTLNGSYYWNLTDHDSDGVVYFPTLAGFYNISVDHPDFALESEMVNLTESSQEIEFILYTFNSIFFNFYDEVGLFKLDFQPVSLEIISTAFSNNYTTSNGSIFLSLLSPSTYTIRTTSDGYTTRFNEYTLINNTNINLDVYLTNNSNSNFKTIEATVLNENSDPVEDVLIKVLRYDISSNSYTVREEVRTNFEGQADLSLIKNEEYYKFVLVYGGKTKLTTQKTQIFEDSITFRIVVAELAGETLFYVTNVEGDVSFNNNTNIFRFYYNDPNNQVTQGCLDIYKTKYDGKTSISTQCVSGTSGYIYYTITPENSTTFVGNGYVYFGDTQRFIDSRKYTFISEQIQLGVDAYLGLFLLTCLFAMFGVWNLVVAVVLTPLPTLIFSSMGWIPFDFKFALAFQVVAVFFAWMLSRRS